MNQTDIKPDQNNTSFNPENITPKDFPEVDTEKTEEVIKEENPKPTTNNEEDPKAEKEKPIQIDDINPLTIPMTGEQEALEVKEEPKEEEEPKGNFEGTPFINNH
jgi:hypothetical protein